jgi:hypothetical protein
MVHSRWEGVAPSRHLWVTTASDASRIAGPTDNPYRSNSSAVTSSDHHAKAVRPRGL